MCWCAVPSALRRNIKKGTIKMSLVGTNVTMVGGLAKVTGAINYALTLFCRRCFTRRRCEARSHTRNFCA